jgi:hypothetical protein
LSISGVKNEIPISFQFEMNIYTLMIMVMFFTTHKLQTTEEAKMGEVGATIIA